MFLNAFIHNFECSNELSYFTVVYEIIIHMQLNAFGKGEMCK